MHYYNRIKALANERKVSLKILAEKVNVSEQGLHRMIKHDTMQIKLLQDIADFFHVPITYFFEGVGMDRDRDIDLVFEKLKEIVKRNL